MAEEDKPETLWVISNRKDDRVVLFERDPAHPYGEAFVGGAAPAFVGRSGQVEQLLHAGLIVEVPEPKDGPKKPLPLPLADTAKAAAQPGQAIPLGRQLDSDLFPEGAIARVKTRQDALPKEVPAPAGAVTPQAPKAEKETKRK